MEAKDDDYILPMASAPKDGSTIMVRRKAKLTGSFLKHKDCRARWRGNHWLFPDVKGSYAQNSDLAGWWPLTD